MAVESLIVAQMLRLFDERPGVVWQLVRASEPLRAGDVALYDLHGASLAYARPAQPEAHPIRAAAR
jgi:hypothetical protein